MVLDGCPAWVSLGQWPHYFEAPALDCHDGNKNAGNVTLLSGSENTGQVRLQVWHQVAGQEGRPPVLTSLCPSACHQLTVEKLPGLRFDIYTRGGMCISVLKVVSVNKTQQQKQ